MDKVTKEQIKQAIETYNKYAKIYAEYTAQKLLQFQLNEFISMLPKGGKVLDAGCGCGRDALYLMEDGLDVIGVDVSEGMIKEARKKKVKVRKMDMCALKFKEEFDGVWCMASLSDVSKKDASKVIKNFFKVLKEKGKLYIAVKEGEGEKIEEKERYSNSPRFYAYYSKDELESLLKDSGFSILKSIKSDDSGTGWIEIFASKN